MLETNWNREVSFWVMPTEAQSKANLDWVKSKFSHQVYEESVYIAPNYPRTGKIEDPRLLSILKSKNPDNVFIQIGGGVQERLGLYLKDNLRERTTVICTGAALAFLSGQQVKIPMWADRLFLGWFFRCLTKPRIFVPRYLKAFYLFYLLLRFDSNEPDFPESMIYSEKVSKRACVKALGCRLNQYEIQGMENKLKANGYEIVPFGERADLGVINTCTVTNEADAKSRNAIRRFIRRNPKGVTVVVGCYSQISANEISMIDGVDYVIGNHDKMNFLNYLGEGKNEVPVIVRERISKEDFTIGFTGESSYQQRSNLKIQDGCDFMCTFCVIPFARGRARSRSWNDLHLEAKGMLGKGVEEIVLTGVNLGTYESEKRNFLDLISSLSSLNGMKRLRISSIEPTTIPEELFEMMADQSHPLMPYLHVPMQSGCDSVLKSMRRKYLLEEMEEFFRGRFQQFLMFVLVLI